MKRVERSELLELGAYEEIRERFRARIIAEKRERRLTVSDETTAIFENHETVLFQIQEMLRTERITKEAAIEHELETYNELIPGRDELSATMFVEVADAAEREQKLVTLAGLEQHIALEVAGQLVRAKNETRGVLPDRTTAVHYLRFPLGAALAERWRKARAELEVAFVLDHPKLRVRTVVPRSMVAALVDDLMG